MNKKRNEQAKKLLCDDEDVRCDDDDDELDGYDRSRTGE